MTQATPESFSLSAPAEHAVAPDQFRLALRKRAAAVTIVTTRYLDAIHSMTVTSVSGICLSPPLMLVCIAKCARTHQLVANSQIFAVNLLHQEQREPTEGSASRESRDDHFCGVTFQHAVTGAPILSHSLAYFDCGVVAAHDGGDHTIFVGQVYVTGILCSGLPLIYHESNYLAIA